MERKGGNDQPVQPRKWTMRLERIELIIKAQGKLKKLIRQLGPVKGVMLWVMCCPKGLQEQRIRI